MKLLIFTEGTLLMHENGVWKSREKIVEQVKQNDPSVHNFSSYIPIGKCIDKLNNWKEQNVEMIYLTSRKTSEEVEAIKNILKDYEFPPGNLEFRQENETYAEIVERVIPDVLIEDDCESIGGEKEMSYTNIQQELKNKIKLIIVKEFEGIDHLPSHFKEIIA